MHIRQVKHGTETARFRLGFTIYSCYTYNTTRVNMLAFDLIALRRREVTYAVILTSLQLQI